MDSGNFLPEVPHIQRDIGTTYEKDQIDETVEIKSPQDIRNSNSTSTNQQTLGGIFSQSCVKMDSGDFLPDVSHIQRDNGTTFEKGQIDEIVEIGPPQNQDFQGCCVPEAVRGVN